MHYSQESTAGDLCPVFFDGKKLTSLRDWVNKTKISVMAWFLKYSNNSNRAVNLRGFPKPRIVFHITTLRL